MGAEPRTAAEHGPIDVLVHNAGVERPVALVDRTETGIDREIAINLTAPIQLTREVRPAMLERGRDAVVLVSSMSGTSPTPWNTVYAATNHGLVGLASSLRLELQGTGSTSGSCAPGSSPRPACGPTRG